MRARGAARRDRPRLGRLPPRGQRPAGVRLSLAAARRAGDHAEAGRVARRGAATPVPVATDGWSVSPIRLMRPAPAADGERRRPRDQPGAAPSRWDELVLGAGQPRSHCRQHPHRHPQPAPRQGLAGAAIATVPAGRQQRRHEPADHVQSDGDVEPDEEDLVKRDPVHSLTQRAEQGPSGCWTRPAGPVRRRRPAQPG